MSVIFAYSGDLVTPGYNYKRYYLIEKFHQNVAVLRNIIFDENTCEYIIDKKYKCSTHIKFDEFIKRYNKII